MIRPRLLLLEPHPSMPSTAAPQVYASLRLDVSLSTDPVSVQAAAWTQPEGLALLLSHQLLEPVRKEVHQRLLELLPLSHQGGLAGDRDRAERFVYELRLRERAGR